MVGKSKKVAVIGLGYVGLTTSLCFSSKGMHVTGVDVDKGRVDAVNDGHLPIHEPRLGEVLVDALDKGFKATTTIPGSDVYFVTVGTPSKKDGSVDLSYVESVSEEIGKAIRERSASNYPLVVVKSTVPPGTTRNVVRPRVERTSDLRAGTGVGFCSNPEFLREGSAVEDTFNPDRIIIGEYDKESGRILEDLHRDFYEATKMPPLIRTTIENAELTKYANNAFLATKVSFINEIANMCQKIPGADVTVIAKGIGLDRRIGERFLNAGLGWGGSCFPKDVRALIAFSKSIGYRPLIVDSTLEVNDKQPYNAVDMAKSILGGLRGRRIALLGLSFKPDTDDIREAVSLKIIRKLLDEEAKVVAYDPTGTPNVERIFGGKITYSTSSLECLKEADCCIIVTEWDEFRKLTPNDFLDNMKNPVVIDGRRIFNVVDFANKKVKLTAIGLGKELDRV
ncbi:MAG: UDP-glucose/GDP-mannose dehydrogenase family protein [Promethearchaeati archaeon SRVP18_Atabeyarchaeia-1]